MKEETSPLTYWPIILLLTLTHQNDHSENCYIISVVLPEKRIEKRDCFNFTSKKAICECFNFWGHPLLWVSYIKNDISESASFITYG